MNIFVNFVQNLRFKLFQSAHAQALGSNLETLTLIPNSLLPNKFLIQRKVYPTQKLTNPEFVYTNSTNTNISTTFQKAKDARLRTNIDEHRTGN